ncbi:transglutaminase-like domain-containing protein [Desulfofustis limnaeus]|jgi:hypothetical protein|uniref:Transglutaminase-like domain-containing protein n=1 Tax=Desulfofustis limnaeus TaxID=2740163 RepID=A0ABM7WA50_9BACT|nr:transglutaminase-like domain-containing protein [Desulfofustis limnaeus]MDX9894772.1 transglutaminase-like domain-containing protein [Desulfofustis sp.]BDD87818.1 hypothetical protein DPPLL_21830 [Desulfofustis limnaeus]
MRAGAVITPARVVKSLVWGVWLILLVLLLWRDFFVSVVDSRESAALERDRRTEYQGIYFKEQKIGYVEYTFAPAAADTLTLHQRAVMDLNISGQSHPVDLDLQATIDQYSRLQAFHFAFTSPFYRMTADGTVSGSAVSFTLDTGNAVIEDRLSLEAPPLLPTSRRAYLLDRDLQSGEKIRIPWFDPLSLTAKSSLVEYHGKEKTLIHQRVYQLHRFTEQFAGIRVNVWLDDQGEVVKEESPAGFVFIREPEFKAKQMDHQSPELLAGVAVPVIGAMPEVGNKTSQRYRLHLPETAEFTLSSGRQSFADSILTVTRETIPDDVHDQSRPCADGARELASSPYIQTDAPEIVTLAEEIAAAPTSPTDRTQALADWVYQNLEKRPVIGIPDALSTLKSGHGDCNEHASLFAALARAAGIPTKIAVGVVYQQDAFYYHAWNEVCLNGTWISLDTTTNQFPADLTHLKFVEGELQEQLRIGALLNTLKIEPLPD